MQKINIGSAKALFYYMAVSEIGKITNGTIKKALLSWMLKGLNVLQSWILALQVAKHDCSKCLGSENPAVADCKLQCPSSKNSCNSNICFEADVANVENIVSSISTRLLPTHQFLKTWCQPIHGHKKFTLVHFPPLQMDQPLVFNCNLGASSTCWQTPDQLI